MSMYFNWKQTHIIHQRNMFYFSESLHFLLTPCFISRKIYSLKKTLKSGHGLDFMFNIPNKPISSLSLSDPIHGPLKMSKLSYHLLTVIRNYKCHPKQDDGMIKEGHETMSFVFNV